MLFSDLIQETFFSLSSNKGRSALTILGIVIGIGSVISLTSIGQGASAQITSNIESLGTNLLMVMPGSQRNIGSGARGGTGSATTLTREDSDAIRTDIEGITAVAPSTSSREQVIAGGENTNTNIYGIDENYFAVKNVLLSEGNLINEQNISRRSKVAILGPETSTTLFGEGISPVGERVHIGDQQFTVIGVTEVKGGTGFMSADDLIYIPITTAQQYFTGNSAVSTINIQVADKNMMTTVQEATTSLLLVRHNIADVTSADFSVMNQADILNTMSSVTGTMTLLLGAIAGISLLVGGIGIMNMMLTTVTERTREIGLRKSLGAKNRDISNQFLAESVTLTFIGGVIGIMLGWGVSLLISTFSPLQTVVTLSSIILAVGVAAGVGIVFGYYPARRAAKMDPIEALRYE
ncbi:MAG: ABC transporter permease [bacterium]